MSAFSPVRHELTDRVMDVLGLSGKKLRSIQFTMTLDIDSIVTLDVKYTEVVGEKESLQLVEEIAKYELHEKPTEVTA